jgi:hypothetical protein
MRWFIETVRQRGDEHGLFEDSIPAPDTRAEAKELIEHLIRLFPHKGYNEEHDYWWAWSDDEPERIHRWVLRDRVP